jgi:hypothetical protein
VLEDVLVEIGRRAARCPVLERKEAYVTSGYAGESGAGLISGRWDGPLPLGIRLHRGNVYGGCYVCVRL